MYVCVYTYRPTTNHIGVTDLTQDRTTVVKPILMMCVCVCVCVCVC